MKKLSVLTFPVFIIFFAVVVTSLTATNKAPVNTVVYRDSLPVVGSYENLKALLAKSQNSVIKRKGLLIGAPGTDYVTGAPNEQKSMRAAESDSSGAGYSGTNVQVQGVDEADLVKTDGRYIYQVNSRKIVIARVYPPGEMQVAGTVTCDDEKFTPQELYIDDKHMVVIGSGYYNISVPVPEPVPQPEPVKPGPAIKQSSDSLKSRRAAASARPNSPPARPGICPPLVQNTTKAIIFDIGDKTNIKKLREVELEGSYVSSRKIGSALYLAANKYINYYRIMEQEAFNPAPAYRDTAKGKGLVTIAYKDIRYFPDSVQPNYLLVGGLDLDSPEAKMEVSTYLGSGENIYASRENMYIAVTGYQEPVIKPDRDNASVKIKMPAPAPQPGTAVYKFALANGRAEYKGSGEVPGAVLNQFSMDEYNGSFRIATTSGEIWRSDEYTSKNNVYILDQNLKTTGRLEDIAPGERIYSVRFMGERGYMVTFKQVDPLFVLDLKDPQSPKVLGALKIPGYSDYLHPFDENHIIGFGKDTEEGTVGGVVGSTEKIALYQGMKIAVFDVSDMAHPVEMFKETIGDRGTDSELLRNHKALLFDREKNLLAFPVTVMESKAGSEQKAPFHYGEFTFQGAYVYNIDLTKGFTLKGRITHLSGEDTAKAGWGWYSSGKNIDRILYIDDTLYTVSKAMIKANDLGTLKETGSLKITE